MRRLLLFVLMLVMTASAQEINQRYRAVHDATHEISQSTILDPGVACSSTAIGPHALLYASHCEEPTDTLSVDEKDARIVELVRDGNDHTIALLDGIRFKTFVTVNQSHIAVGDDVYLFGNPTGFSDLLRRGYLAGYKNLRKLNELIFDINSFHGDSGSGIFNSKGELVAVISTRFENQTFYMAGALPLNFTDEQLKKAREFDEVSESRSTVGRDLLPRSNWTFFRGDVRCH